MSCPDQRSLRDNSSGTPMPVLWTDGAEARQQAHGTLHPRSQPSPAEHLHKNTKQNFYY